MKKDKKLILDGPPVMSPEEMIESWTRSAEKEAKDKISSKDK